MIGIPQFSHFHKKKQKKNFAYLYHYICFFLQVFPLCLIIVSSLGESIYDESHKFLERRKKQCMNGQPMKKNNY